MGFYRQLQSTGASVSKPRKREPQAGQKRRRDSGLRLTRLTGLRAAPAGELVNVPQDDEAAAAAAASAGPPLEVIPFVFGEVSDLSNERFYRPYILELLASSGKYPEDFDRVFWKTLKQQMTGTYQLKSFLAFFLSNTKITVGGLTGLAVRRRFDAAFLEEGRSNSVTHQLDGLITLWSVVAVKCSSTDRPGLWELCQKFEEARAGNACEAQQIAAHFPREEPPWREPRATREDGADVRTVALPSVQLTTPLAAPDSHTAAAPTASDAPDEVAASAPSEGIPTDAPDEPRDETRPLVAAAQVPRGEALQVGHPSEVVPFVFGEASSLHKERFYPPFFQELLMSWYAFPEHFEDVFWKILLQQTTGTYSLENFLCGFLADREVTVGTLTGASLMERLAPRFLEAARCSPVTHQLDQLECILKRVPYEASPGETTDTLEKLKKQFKKARKKNGFEARAVGERYPRETPPWRTVTSADQPQSADA